MGLPAKLRRKLSLTFSGVNGVSTPVGKPKVIGLRSYKRLIQNHFLLKAGNLRFLISDFRFDVRRPQKHRGGRQDGNRRDPPTLRSGAARAEVAEKKAGGTGRYRSARHPACGWPEHPCSDSSHFRSIRLQAGIFHRNLLKSRRNRRFVIPRSSDEKQGAPADLL